MPDLILLTLDSDMAGLEFVRTLKGEPDWRTIPVVVFSGGAGPHEAAAVRASGVSDYRTKPLDFEGHIEVALELDHRLSNRFSYRLLSREASWTVSGRIRRHDVGKISRSVNTRNVFAVLRRSFNLFFKIRLLSFVFAHIF